MQPLTRCVTHLPLKLGLDWHHFPKKKYFHNGTSESKVAAVTDALFKWFLVEAART